MRCPAWICPVCPVSGELHLAQPAPRRYFGRTLPAGQFPGAEESRPPAMQRYNGDACVTGHAAGRDFGHRGRVTWHFVARRGKCLTTKATDMPRDATSVYEVLVDCHE